MARPNRNNQDRQEITVAKASAQPAYRTAIYARLSIEDNGCGSDSIENQVELLKRYVGDNHDLTLISIFLDNGMTGTTFDRPGFIAMLDALKTGKINCIVVKDLSRFGRNYMEAGNYLEQLFPYLGVRFISVNDKYDSIAVTANEALALSLKNVYHHIYAKDISRKICTLFDAKKKQGLFLGSFAPYGYKKSESNRYRLEIDGETVGVVRDIFQLRLDGMGATSIARVLNDRGIPSHSKLLFEKGCLKGTNGEAKALWSGGSVKGILENPIYCGCMVERKSDQAYYKGVHCELPKSEWVYIENTHEAIIDKATFEKIAQLIAESKKAVSQQLAHTSDRERTENMLRGMLVCGYCKKKMARDGGYYDANGNLLRHRFACSAKYRKDGNCRSASKGEAELLETLFCIVKTQLQVLADLNELLKESLGSARCDKQRNGLQHDLREAASQIALVQSHAKDLYHAYKKGLLSERAYVLAQSEFERALHKLEQRRAALQHTEKTAKVLAAPDTDRLGELLAFQREPALSRKMCEALIEKVEVYDSHLVVYYTFASEYEQMVSSLSACAEVGGAV